MHGVFSFNRRTFLTVISPGFLASGSLLLASDEAASIRLVIRDASRALQAGNAPLFLSKFDSRSMQRFDDLRMSVEALTAQRTIASSVENGPPRVENDERIVSVDWLLQLTPISDPGPVEIRQESLSLRFAERKGKWKIVTLEPVEFFRSR